MKHRWCLGRMTESVGVVGDDAAVQPLLDLSRWVRIARSARSAECFDEIAAIHQAVSVRVGAALKALIRCNHFLGAHALIFVGVGDGEEPIAPGFGWNAAAKVVWY